MTLLGFEGFERVGYGNVYQNSSLLTTYSITTPSGANYAAGRVLGYAARAGSSSSNSLLVQMNTPTAINEGVVGFAAQHGPSHAWQGWKFREGTTVHFSLGWNSVSQLLELRTAAGAVLASSAGSIDYAQWNYIEVKFKVADAGGYVIVRINETVIINYSGDTRNGGAAGAIDNVHQAGSGSASFILVDDFYCLDLVDATATQGRPNNDFLGDVVVEPLRPSGNGEQNQWLGSDGNSVDNYLLLDEVPVSSTDYVGTATSGARDNYGMGDLTEPGAVVFGVNHEVFAAKSDVNPLIPNLEGTLKQGATESIQTIAVNTLLSTNWAWYRSTQHVKDLNGALWTPSSVASLVAGVKVS